MYTFTENSLDLQIAAKVYSLLELAREALGVFLAMCFWLTDHILNVVNRGFLSARFLLVEGPTLKLLHQQSLQENAVQQNRAGGYPSADPRAESFGRGSPDGEKRGPGTSSQFSHLWNMWSERPSGTNVTGSTAESGSLPAEHQLPTTLLNLTWGNKASRLWQPHIAEKRAEVQPWSFSNKEQIPFSTRAQPAGSQGEGEILHSRWGGKCHRSWRSWKASALDWAFSYLKQENIAQSPSMSLPGKMSYDREDRGHIYASSCVLTADVSQERY